MATRIAVEDATIPTSKKRASSVLLLAALAIAALCCKPSAKDVIRAAERGELQTISRMLGSREEAQVSAVIKAWPANPVILRAAWDHYIAPGIPETELRTFFERASKIDPVKFGEFLAEHASSLHDRFPSNPERVVSLASILIPLSPNLTGRYALTQQVFDARRQIIAEAARKPELPEVVSYLEAAAEMRDVADGAGKGDEVRCTPAHALRGVWAHIVDAPDSPGLEQLVSRIMAVSCPEVSSKLLDALSAHLEGSRASMLREDLGAGASSAVNYLRFAQLVTRNSNLAVPEQMLRSVVTGADSRRTAAAELKSLQDELKGLKEERGQYHLISGYIVGSIGPKTYEYAVAGPCYGTQGYCPSGPHQVLDTVTSTFGSKGWFSMWAKGGGVREFHMKNGFTERWSVWKEAVPPTGLDAKIASKRSEVAHAKGAAARQGSAERADRKAVGELLASVLERGLAQYGQ